MQVSTFSAEHIGAIILAAGDSTRMGRVKALLPWAGKTLLEWQAGELRDAGVDEVIVVLGSRAGEVRPAAEATGARIVLNEAYREGRASSLRRGAEAVGDGTDAVIVLNVDQPRPAWVTARLVETWRERGPPIVSPAHRGNGGHPVLIDGSLLPELRVVEDATLGLRALIERHQADAQVLEFENICVIVDLNTPAEYEAALIAFNRGDWDADLGAA